MHRRTLLKIGFGALLGLTAFRPARADAGADTLFLEDLTWIEIRDRVAAGMIVAIVPTGGTEQNGAHMALGKHDIIVRHNAAEIARRLGNALVAPVLPYVPEGGFDPPDDHMAFPGSLGLSDHAFEVTLRDIATSLALAGFRLICFLGNHGESQAVQSRVARTLSRAWRRRGVRVANLDRYYFANGQVQWLESQGFDDAAIGRHAGLPDTAELMALAPDRLRPDRLAPGTWPAHSGANGDPSKATPAMGEHLLALKIAAGEAQVRELLATLRPAAK
jgi:creatinine amidohydrolase/Fe(II)-dependent formamide hydrolase-like protein